MLRRCSLILLCLLLLGGCAFGFTKPKRSEPPDPPMQPLNEEGQKIVYRECSRMKLISCSISSEINVLILESKRPWGDVDSEAQAMSMTTLWCKLNNEQGSIAHIWDLYPDKTMKGWTCNP
jgi:hypothetical protein